LSRLEPTTTSLTAALAAFPFIVYVVVVRCLFIVGFVFFVRALEGINATVSGNGRDATKTQIISVSADFDWRMGIEN